MSRVHRICTTTQEFTTASQSEKFKDLSWRLPVRSSVAVRPSGRRIAAGQVPHKGNAVRALTTQSGSPKKRVDKEIR